MTAQQVLIKLINMGIVHTIEDKYYISDRVYKALDSLDINENVIELDTKSVSSNASLYPEPIRNASPSNKIKALLDYCKVPLVSEKGGYVLRSQNGVSKRRVEEIMQDTSIDIPVLLKSIEDYYKIMEYPKGFARYVNEGDIMTMYQYYKQGNTLSSDIGELPDNIRWD